MKFYYFGAFIEEIKTLEDSGFSGVLFTFDNQQGDFFTRIANTINETKKIKFMVAIRPYVISPQYLCMINQSMEMISPRRLQLNLISGHIKQHEENIGGIVGDVNDSSSKIDRSNYLISFLDTMNSIQKPSSGVAYIPDFYVSATNSYVFNAASKHKNKMIVQYREFLKQSWTEYYDNGMHEGPKFDLTGQKVMVSVGPIIRKTQEEIDNLDKPYLTNDTAYFTHDELKKAIKDLEDNGIDEILMFAWPAEEQKYIINFVKDYTENQSEVK